MHIESLNQEMMILGVNEALDMSAAELAGWNILSIRGRMFDFPLSFPGARRIKTLHFDDVLADVPEDNIFCARPEDIQAAIAFSREIGDEPLLIHCQAGISRSTAIAWILLYDKLKDRPGAVHQSFDIVRKLRPILWPNRHVLRLGVEALVLVGRRRRIMQEFLNCLDQLDDQPPDLFYSDRDNQ
jgi:predicted protein tyrosine phosphatase